MSAGQVDIPDPADWLRDVLNTDLTFMRGDDCEHDIDCPKRRAEQRNEPAPVDCQCHILEDIACAEFHLFVVGDHKRWLGWGGNRPTCARCYDGDDPHEDSSRYPCEHLRKLAACYQHRPGYKAEEWVLGEEWIGECV